MKVKYHDDKIEITTENPIERAYLDGFEKSSVEFVKINTSSGEVCFLEIKKAKGNKGR